MNIGKAAFKWFKTNMYSPDEIAEILHVDLKTLQTEFEKYCQGTFLFPGVYLVGNQHLQIAEAVRQWQRVLVQGNPGTGKTVLSLAAAKSLSKNLGKPESLTQLEKMIRSRHPGIILVDDADCMGKNYKNVLALASDFGVRIIATVTGDGTIPGFHTFKLTPPTPKEMEELAGVKGWRFQGGSSNLTDAVKHNLYNGGTASIKDDSNLQEIINVLSGKGTNEADKSMIEQVARNALEMTKDPSEIDTIMRSCASAWKTLFAGGNPSPALSTVPLVRGSTSIFYKKSQFSEEIAKE